MWGGDSERGARTGPKKEEEKEGDNKREYSLTSLDTAVPKQRQAARAATLL